MKKVRPPRRKIDERFIRDLNRCDNLEKFNAVVYEYNIRYLEKSLEVPASIREKVTKMYNGGYFLKPKARLTMGLHNHPLRHVWKAMNRRCSSPKEPLFHRYGGRGIKVCDEWKDSLMEFFHWANNNGYKKGLWIDRIDNDKGYCPENCKWVTTKQSAKNTSRNILYTEGGKTMILKDWCIAKGLRYEKVVARINRGGYSVEDALNGNLTGHKNRSQEQPRWSQIDGDDH